MADLFIGQIIEVGFNFAPSGCAYCNGQLMSIAQNPALFALIGTTFGGDGQQTFGLPDLQGRTPIHMDQGPGLTNRVIGEKSGSETVTLTISQLPQHTHQLLAYGSAGSSRTAQNNLLGSESQNKTSFYSPAPSPNVLMDPRSLANTGGNQPHTNIQPYLAVNYCIALLGIFPTRN